MPMNAQQPSDFDTRLSLNEAPQPPSVGMDRILQSVALNRYPDSAYPDLTAAIATHFNLSPGTFVLGNGSDECIRMAIDALTKPGDAIVIPVPTFGEYKRLCDVTYRRAVEVLQPGFAFDVTSTIHAVQRHGAALVFLCSPNNPTGHIISRNDLIFLLESVDAWVILDEAYVEFAEGSLCDLTARYDRLLVLRTLSKAYGIAALRVGYCVGQVQAIDMLKGIKSPYPISALSAALTCEALSNHDTRRQLTLQTIALRDAFINRIQRLNALKAYPSHSNFVLIDCGKAYEKLTAALSQEGFQVRTFKEPSLASHIRISIGHAPVMDRLYALIERTLS